VQIKFYENLRDQREIFNYLTQVAGYRLPVAGCFLFIPRLF